MPSQVRLTPRQVPVVASYLGGLGPETRKSGSSSLPLPLHNSLSSTPALHTPPSTSRLPTCRHPPPHQTWLRAGVCLAVDLGQVWHNILRLCHYPLQARVADSAFCFGLPAVRLVCLPVMLWARPLCRPTVLSLTFTPHRGPGELPLSPPPPSKEMDTSDDITRALPGPVLLSLELRCTHSRS